jgi:putative mRNA 3-end processing factor
MELQFLGGAGEVGRSALLVDDSLLVDYGTLTGEPPQYPVSRPEPDAVVVSHGHLDHVGSLPALLAGDGRPPIHWTPPTEELTHTLARDTIKLRGGTYDCPFTGEHVRRLSEVSERHGYRETFDAAGYEVTLYNAGHIPGSAHVLVDDGETRLLYTGDFYVDRSGGDDDPAGGPSRVAGGLGGQRLVPGTTARPDADVVVCESTYSDVEHPPRGRVEREFVESVRETVWEGGTVVVPAFAIGRTQEALMVLDAAGIDCYVDGMGVGVGEMLKRHPEYVRDADALRSALSNVRVVDGRDGQRRRIASENTVVVTTSGMPGNEDSLADAAS